MAAMQPSPQSATWAKAGRLQTNISVMTSSSIQSKHQINAKEHPLTPSSKSSKSSKSKDTLWQLGLNILSLGLFAVIVLFVQVSQYAQQDAEQKRQLAGILRTNASLTLAILRTAQAVLSTLTTLGLDNALEFIQWTLMNTDSGLPFSSLLALSPATGQIGMLQLFFSEGALTGARLWTLLRGALIFSIWLSGIVLFYNTNLITVYDTAYTYNVSAGVGPFNASLVAPFTSYLQDLSPSYPYTVLPYTYYAAAYTLVLNPLIATIVDPVSCASQKTGDCMSYLFTGGLEMVAPWVPSEHTDYPMIKVDSAPAVQMDFSGVLEVDQEPFAEADCDVFGDNETTIGIRLCLEEEAAGTLRAGLFLCNGTQGGTTCQPYAHGQSLNITTRLALYTREASFVAARANYSIVSVAQTQTAHPSSASRRPALSTVDPVAYRAALAWLLNYTAAAVPAPSSLVESFWSSNLQLGGGPPTYGLVTQNFQSVLAFPTWLFNANNWGNTALRSNVTVPGMPAAFYTTAGVVRPVATYAFDEGMFGLFVGLQGVAMVFMWGVLVWVWVGGARGGGGGGTGSSSSSSSSSRGRRLLPETSSFPLFDVLYKIRVDGERWPGDVIARASGSEVVGCMKGAVVRTKESAERTGTPGGPRPVARQ